MEVTRQTIAVIITFRRSNKKKSLERRPALTGQAKKKNPLYFNKVPLYRNFASDYEHILQGVVSITTAVLVANSACSLYIFLCMIVKSLKMASLRLKNVAAIVAFKTNSCLRCLIIDNIQQGCTSPGYEVAASRLNFLRWRLEREGDSWILGKFMHPWRSVYHKRDRHLTGNFRQSL